MLKIPREEHFFFPTSDGVTLCITRYQPVHLIEGREPLILCHGVACTRYFYDLDENHSLARYLQMGGFDVWVLELRGFGLSERPRLWQLGKWEWSVDTYIEYDVPAAIDFVLSMTGANQVFWIGHSMGGAVAYGYMIRRDQSKMRGVVALGGFGVFAGNELWMRIIRMLGRFSFVLPKDQGLPFDIIAKTLARLPAKRILYRNIFFDLLFNPSNMDPKATAKFFRDVISDTAANVLRQFLHSAAKNDFLSFDGEYSYARNHYRADRPILCIAGANDNLVSPNNVLAVFKRLSSKDKTYILLSRNNGFSADYGHADIVVGKKARFEVYPIIDLWLRQHVTE